MQRRVEILVGAFCIGLVVFNFSQGYLIGIGIFCVMYGLNEALANVAESEVQHNTPSHMRATMLSLVNCAGNLFSVPVVLLFTTYNTHHGILAANRIIIIGVILLLIVTIVWSRTRELEQQVAKI